MQDKINFTGFQNVGGFINQFGMNNRRVSRLVIELNDKGPIQDLLEFGNVFSKYPDVTSKNTMLKIDAIDNEDAIQTVDNKLQVLHKLLYNTMEGDAFYLNGKPLSHETDISVYQKVFNLLKRISESEDKILIDENYVKSVKAKENLFENVDTKVAENLSGYDADIFYSDNYMSKKNVKSFLNGINSSMNRFFGVE